MFKAVLLVCAQALMFQSIAGQCFGARMAAAPLAAAPLATAAIGPLAAGPCGLAGPLATPFAYEAAAVPASNGGGLGVSSASAIPPRGVSVLSENAIEGPLAVAGAVPFLGTVALEGALPTAGAGAVNYACGNGAVAILAEDIAPAGIAAPFGYAAGPLAVDALGYGPLGYAASPLGYAAGPLGNAASPLGYAAGPFAAEAYGYGIGPLAGPYRAGCGYGALI